MNKEVKQLLCFCCQQIKMNILKLRFYTILFLLVIFANASKAQFSFKVEGVVKENGKNLAGAEATLTNDETDGTKQDLTKSSGTFSFNLKPNQEYSIFITKQGYAKVKITYSTMGFSEDDAKKFKGSSSPEIEIFKMPSDSDFVAKIQDELDRPLMSYIYNSDKKTIEPDEETNQEMEKEYVKIQKEVEDYFNRAVPIEAKYNTAITKADKAYALNKYEDARDLYNEALSYKANEQYPKTKLIEIERLIAIDADNKQKAKDKALADAAEKERLAKEKEQQLADAAEKARFEKAKTDSIANEKKRIADEKALADATEKQRLAKEKADADAAEKERLAKIKEQQLADAAEKARLEKAKTDSIASAKQKLIDDKLKADAAEKQRLADEKAKADAAEKERLAKEKAIADAAEKERLEKEAIAKAIDKKYTTFINRGDSAINAVNYDVAKAAFNEALTVKANEAYPKTRLKDIETMILNDELYKNELAKKYPQGVTEEKVKENNMQVTRRILVIGNKGYLYLKKETTFGAIYYSKDGVTITEKEYLKDTELKK